MGLGTRLRLREYYTGTYPWNMLSVCRPALAAIRNRLLRRMSSSSTHLERTQGRPRSELVSDVTVIKIEDLSPSVKGFQLEVDNRQLSFKPGQWVDLHIPGEDIVGGYSFSSAPRLLREQGTIHLAIQYSDHPPTLWMCTKCREGDHLSIRVGGDFWDRSSSPHDLLLIGGGVGINPLFSMMQHQTWLLRSGNTQLLYSAKIVQELLFKDQIDRICADSPKISVRYFVTKENGSHPDVAYHRIKDEDIVNALSVLDKSELQCFICGPPPMIEDMRLLLQNHGLAADSIHFEKWW